MSGSLFVISGEPSSSNYISGIMDELRLKGFKGDVHAVCSEGLSSKGVRVIFDPHRYATVGIFEAVVNLSNYVKLYRITLSAIRSLKPAVVMLMDLPDFNLKIARQLKSLGIPCVYFIPPQVWAWRSSRIETLRKYVHKLFVTFKFEEEFFRSHSLNCECVGHPLTKIISDYKTMDLRKTHEINRSDTLISLFPASRISQFRRFTPMLCKAAFMIERKLSQSGIGCRFMIGLSDNISGYKYRKYITNPKIIEVSGKGYDLMSCSDIVISTCGTTTLEATLFERPMVAFYRINPILARFLRGLFKFSVKYYSLPNLLAGKEVVPELIQERATPENIADAATSVILDGKIHRIKQDLANIKKYLGNINTFDRMADELLKYL